MASLVGECQNVDFEGIEVDGALLMSLLEEDHEERLNRVIESLQAEISNPSSISGDAHHDHDHDDGLGMEGGDWPLRVEDVDDFSWVDEMDMEVMVPSSPSEEMNWYMNEIDVGGFAEFGVVADYSMICNGSIHLEGSLWQEEEDSYDTLMYYSTTC